jgi:hypothetical protein
MERVFTRYIDLVGKNKVKEDLKQALWQAIKEEKWDLSKRIINLIEEYIINK